MNILITGATGFIGAELRPFLLKEGHNLIIVTRNPKTHEDESAKNQRFMSWDDDLAGAMNTTDVVINMAGENIFGQRWTEKVKQKIMQSRIESTRKLVEAMQKAEHKPAVFISFSASGIYDNHGDKILNEQAGHADDFLASVCKNWEGESQKAAELGIRVVNPRLGIVLEQGGGALKQMMPPFRFFVGGPIGSGRQYMSWIHRTDLCRVLRFLCTESGISGACNASAPEAATMNEFAQTLGSVMNRPSLFRVPTFLLRLVLGESAKPVTDSIRMQPEKLLKAGFEFRYEDLHEALADIV